MGCHCILCANGWGHWSWQSFTEIKQKKLKFFLFLISWYNITAATNTHTGSKTALKTCIHLSKIDSLKQGVKPGMWEWINTSHSSLSHSVCLSLTINLHLDSRCVAWISSLQHFLLHQQNIYAQFNRLWCSLTHTQLGEQCVCICVHQVNESDQQLWNV